MWMFGITTGGLRG